MTSHKVKMYLHNTFTHTRGNINIEVRIILLINFASLFTIHTFLAHGVLEPNFDVSGSSFHLYHNISAAIAHIDLVVSDSVSSSYCGSLLSLLTLKVDRFFVS